MNVQSILASDPYYIEERRKEYQRVKEFFTNKLAYYFSIMPPPSRVLDINTGEWSVVNDPKWQALIDKTVQIGNDYLQKEFPEFNDF